MLSISTVMRYWGHFEHMAGRYVDREHEHGMLSMSMA